MGFARIICFLKNLSKYLPGELQNYIIKTVRCTLFRGTVVIYATA
jgi:hypothetical protein